MASLGYEKESNDVISSVLKFQYGKALENGECESHQHSCGQLHHIGLGLIEVDLGSYRLTAPDDYLIWVPANVEHKCSVIQARLYTSVFVNDVLAARLSKFPCLIKITSVVKALLDDFNQRKKCSLVDEWDIRQAELLIEHLVRSDSQETFLPQSKDPRLVPILAEIIRNPSINHTLSHWSSLLHCTERTIARHFLRELGISFSQWRNRALLLKALSLLEEGWSVQKIASFLGYTSVSGFIGMFRNQTGFTPDSYRQQAKKYLRK